MVFKISDFGISRLLEEDTNEVKGSTGRGMSYGKAIISLFIIILYSGWEVAPELLINGTTTFKSDIFQLGMILFQLLTGRPIVEPSDGDGPSCVRNGVRLTVDFAGLILTDSLNP